MTRYRFIEFGYCQLSAEHIPFLVYSIVAGPRGGMYILDEFNTEILLKDIVNTVDISIVGAYKTSVIRRMTLKTITKITYSQHTEKDLKSLSKGYKAKYLSRKDGIKTTKVISKSFDEKQTEFLKTAFEYKYYEVMNNL